MVQEANEMLESQVASLEIQVDAGQKAEASAREALREQSEQQESGIRVLREELEAACSRAEEAETRMAGFATAIRVFPLLKPSYVLHTEGIPNWQG